MKKAFLIIVGIFILMQFIQIKRTNPQSKKELEINAPQRVMTILKRSCYDCHSNETKWPWYSLVAPSSWSIASHVKNGRAWLNFSIWKNYTQEEKQKKLKEIFKAAYAAMPPSIYTEFHQKAIMTKEERTVIRDWAKAKIINR